MTSDPPEIQRRAPRRREPLSPAARRFGFAVAAFVNLLLLYLGNVWPGWQVLPFLTEETVDVLPWINASLATGVVVNLINLVFDRAWLKALGDLATTSVGLVATIQLWAVFPFDFGASTFPWEIAVRTLLILAIVGSAVGIIAAVVAFVRALIRGADAAARPS
ncbi:hypothetical protein [Agromyces bracchium]|uniref:Uncharacterized protein n=1 Tax=Agromyces bracchium TaxID=88376 RepID=A0A6I3M7Y0_9MICO|nr:hypothetical protein [Agromyces bracchium]MTH68227.1 hypothetical protein [Agromyces bracchium]